MYKWFGRFLKLKKSSLGGRQFEQKEETAQEETAQEETAQEEAFECEP